MIKKLLIALLLLMPFAVSAQQTVGSWKVFPTFDTVETIVETPSKVYYLSATKTLYSYDTDTEETYRYGIDNKLTDTEISGVYYNSEDGYLAVAYSSTIIDIIYDNGKVIQLPEINNAVMTKTKAINDITFYGGKMLVTTNFGLVLYDTEKMIVEDSGIYSTELDHATLTDDYYYIHTADNNLGVMPRTEKLNSFDKFTVFTDQTVWTFGMYALDGNKFINYTKNSTAFPVYSYDSASNAMVKDYISVPNLSAVTPTKAGYLVQGATSYAEMKRDGSYTVYDLPEALQSSNVAFWTNPKRLWAGSEEGVGYYDVTDGSVTVLSDRYLPEALTMSNTGRLYMSPSGKLYIYNLCIAHIYTDVNKTKALTLNVLENGKIKDITPQNVEGLVQSNNGGHIWGVTKIVEDPDDPDCIFISSYNDGLFKYKNGEVLTHYTPSNSGLGYYSDTKAIVTSVDIDSKGNLWASCLRKSPSTDLLYVMTPEGRKKNGENTKSDWESIVTASSERDAQVLCCQKSNTVLVNYFGLFGLQTVDSKGTSTTTDDVYKQLGYYGTNYTDQDGKVFTPGQAGWMAEDKNGKVWVGHGSGVFEITDPSKISDANFTVRRLKVPRNDGTNFADYLLDSEFVTGIAVDSNNRKWLSTQASGVYLVSEDGTEIIEHYTTDNSPLPSDAVYAVACDPTSNAVYFGTLAGLVQYNSDSAPSADDYSDVYAYPNPVRPDYTGWIVIKGLMDNSLVKIADAQGNVVYQTTSQGGMVTWDGCNSNGSRVKTGVYYVFASQNATGSNTAAVTKILVVK